MEIKHEFTFEKKRVQLLAWEKLGCEAAEE